MQILSMSIFVESYMKNYMYPSARTSDIEELIGETLKHTPPKPGGTRYKVRIPLFPRIVQPILEYFPKLLLFVFYVVVFF